MTIIPFQTELAEHQGRNDDSDSEHGMTINIFARIAKIGNTKVTLNEQMEKLASSLKRTVNELKQDLSFLKYPTKYS